MDTTAKPANQLRHGICAQAAGASLLTLRMMRSTTLPFKTGACYPPPGLDAR